MILHIRAVEAKGVPNMDIIGLSDPYLKFELSTSTQHWKTRWIRNTAEPTWNDEFHLNITSMMYDELNISLWDKDDISKDDLISTINLNVKNEFPVGKIFDKWYSMHPAKNVKEGGKIHLIVQLTKHGREPFVESQ